MKFLSRHETTITGSQMEAYIIYLTRRVLSKGGNYDEATKREIRQLGECGILVIKYLYLIFQEYIKTKLFLLGNN